MDELCHLQSMIKGIVSTVVKIDAVSCQWLNVDPMGKREGYFLSRSQEKNIAVTEKVSKNVCLLVKSQGNFRQKVRVSPVIATSGYFQKFCVV